MYHVTFVTVTKPVTGNDVTGNMSEWMRVIAIAFFSLKLYLGTKFLGQHAPPSSY